MSIGTAIPEGVRRPTRHRLRWAVPAVMVLVWLAVGAAGGPYNGRLSQVQRNDAASYLPRSAESTRVSALQQQFTTAQTFPAFVLLEGDQPLTAQQVDGLRGLARRIPSIELPVPGHASVTVGDFLVPGETPVIPSQDGKAALALVNFDVNDIGARLKDGTSPIQRSVEALRAEDTSLRTGGLRVYVSGPAGQIADLFKAFGGIDGILLLAAFLTVLVILLVVYRSPVIPLLVLLSAGLALSLASVVVYLLAAHDVITLNGQSQGILSILVVGAATDYALLLVARYKEELRRHDDRFVAMRLAWRRVLEPIAASAGTVILGLLCLLLADLGPTRGLGPVGAIGIASSLLAALTFLPAVLVLPGRTSPGEHGRWIFWPGIPQVGSEGAETKGLWAGVARAVGAHPRRVAGVTMIVLLGLAVFLPTFKAQGIKTAETFRSPVESVTGDEHVDRHFPAGSGSPTIIIGPADKLEAMAATVGSAPGVSAVAPTPATAAQGPGGGLGAPQPPPKVVDGLVELQATLVDSPDSPAAGRTVRRLRTALDADSPDALVGGGAAVNLDVRTTSAADRGRIIPVVLLVIFVVLAALLRAVVAPVVLIIANVLSYTATLGASALVFNHVFRFPGSDPSIPLFGFVFLVALGIDYSIFLMTRVREEAIRRGTRPGILVGLAVTGGVITSAGVVLAATFAALGVLPILFLAQIAFIVAFGVLLDTLVVRSLLVPSVAHVIGPAIWWPGRLARDGRGTAG